MPSDYDWKINIKASLELHHHWVFIFSYRAESKISYINIQRWAAQYCINCYCLKTLSEVGNLKFVCIFILFPNICSIQERTKQNHSKASICVPANVSLQSDKFILSVFSETIATTKNSWNWCKQQSWCFLKRTDDLSHVFKYCWRGQLNSCLGKMHCLVHPSCFVC